MKNYLITFLILLLAAIILHLKPKRDFSHVPKEYQNMVDFAMSAGY